MDIQGVHAKVLILQCVLGVAHFFLLLTLYSRQQGDSGRKSFLPPGATLSFKKTQEWNKGGQRMFFQVQYTRNSREKVFNQ